MCWVQSTYSITKYVRGVRSMAESKNITKSFGVYTIAPIIDVG